MSETIHYRICPLCEACCGLDIRIANGRVAGIRGTEADVLSRGYICPKGFALKDLHEDPDRLRSPLIRRGDRFVEASWDEAFAEIERRLLPIVQAHGRDSVALTVGNPSAHKMGLILYFARLAKALGTKNIFSASTLDQMPKQLSCGWMFGHWLSIPVPDIDRAQFLLIIGANPMASNGSLWTVPDYRGRAKALRARGGRIVVIDPRRTETAEAADAHHFIRPGTDVFLLAAMAQVLFADGLVRPGRAEPWLAGVDAVRDAVAPFTPEAVAARCGIAADTIRALARELATAESGCIYGRIGTCTQRWGSASSWLIDVLNALTGRLDAEGGAMWPCAPAFARNTEGNAGPPQVSLTPSAGGSGGARPWGPADSRSGIGGGIVTGRHRSRVSGAPEVYGELPITLLAEEIETPGPGQVRALISVASNPVLSSPNGERLSKALDSLDFMVSLDIYRNETTRHADVILPGASPLEDGHWDVAFPQFSIRNQARYSPPVLPRAPGALPEWQILLKLAGIALGRGANADPIALDDERVAADVQKLAGAQADAVLATVSRWQGPERLLDLSLRAGPYGDGFGARPDGLTLEKVAARPGGIDLGPLQPRLPDVLRTPSGRIELAPPPLLAELAEARAELAAPVPDLLIVGRREVRSNNSWMHNLPTLAKGPERCTLLLHPADAARHGVVDGQRVTVTGPQGEVVAPVRISDEMMPGVVSLPHGWGHDLEGAALQRAAERPGANLNALLDDRLRDPLSGNAVLSGVPVRLSAAI
jgi:anaerobic selenocysteine-containing dehydrogenase